MKITKKLRIIINSNIRYCTSGYGTQLNEFLPLIRDEGYAVAEIDFYGLEGAILDIDGIRHYPKIADMWGGDAMVAHGLDFKADVTLTLQDIWTLDPNFMKQARRIIPYCLDGKTLVSFVDGKRIRIKEIVENKIEGYVWGYKNGKVIKSKIKAWQQIPEKQDVYELKTSKRTLYITGNNEIWVSNIVGKASATNIWDEFKPEWKRTDCIIPGDVVYLLRNEPRNKKNELSEVKKNRNSLFGGDNRWRGNYNYSKSEKNKSQKRDKTSYTSNDTNIKYKRGIDKMVWTEGKIKNKWQTQKYGEQVQSSFGKINKRNKNRISDSDLGIQRPTYIRIDLPISYRKEQTSRKSNRVYKIKNKETTIKAQSNLLKERNRIMGTSKDIKSEIVLAIRKVKAPKRTVYDISTETGNFFANQILVHNCPIDHEPVPPAILDRLRLCYRIIAPSPYAQRELIRQGLSPTYIPWTVDTDIFKPLPDKAGLRKGLGIPTDHFVFGMVAANKDNPPRKSFQEVMDAFKLFHDKHPKSLLYFHTLIDQQGGFPIRQYAKVLGINEVVYSPPPYVILFKAKREDLAKVYNTFDCLLAPSMNGGFEIPIIEAGACEVPSITNNFTAMRDLVEDGVTGYKTKVIYKRFTQLLSYVGVPSVDSLYEKMELMYKADRIKMGTKMKEFVVKNFDTHTVFKTKWVPYLTMLENEIYPPIT